MEQKGEYFMVNNSYKITKEQHEFLSNRGNASAYLRELIDREMGKESNKENNGSSLESLVEAINFKTAVMIVMLNEIVKANPELNKAHWMDVDLSYEGNWSKVFKEATDYYMKKFIDKR
ncbi:MAG: hypothetical protein GX666_03485 [Tissierellia bacterium]|nr:hypothetical protein [Tissierellia bacterium]